MLGSPHARTAAFAALLTLVLVGWDQCASRDLHERALAEVDGWREQPARGVAAELGDRAIAAVPAAQLAALADHAGRYAGVRVTLIDVDGFLRADSEVTARNLPAIENHAHREEVIAAAAGGVGHATRASHTVGRMLRYVAVSAPGGGVVRVADDLTDVEQRVALARSHALGLIAIAAVSALALFHAFAWLFHRRPLADLRRMAAEVAEGRLDARVPRTGDPDLAPIARAIEQLAGQLRSRLREVSEDEAQLGAVLEAMVQGVLVVDARGTILLANSRLRELFDIQGEIAGRPLLEGVRNADLDAILAESAATDETVARSIALPRPNDRTLQVLAARFPSEAERTGTVTVLHATTECMLLEEVRRDFVANASHELRTPLAAIRGFAETLLESASLSPEEQKN